MNTTITLRTTALYIVLALFVGILTGCQTSNPPRTAMLIGKAPRVYTKDTTDAQGRLYPLSPFQVAVVNNSSTSAVITDGQEAIFAQVQPQSVVILNLNHFHRDFKSEFYLFAAPDGKTPGKKGGRIASEKFYFYHQSMYTIENRPMQHRWELRDESFEKNRGFY